MLGMSRIAAFFQWFVVPDVRKVASLKRRVLRQLFSIQMKNGTPLWREAHLQVKLNKKHQCGNNFGGSDAQKWHAAVARSTFASQNAQNTAGSDQFWTFWCSKMAHRCGAKQICKSKCAKHLGEGPILEGPIRKNCTPLWREVHFRIKMCKTPHVRSFVTLDFSFFRNFVFSGCPVWPRFAPTASTNQVLRFNGVFWAYLTGFRPHPGRQGLMGSINGTELFII